MNSNEPQFMRELHRVREELSKEWEKMSDKEFVQHMRKVGRKFKKSLSPTKHFLRIHSD